MSPEDELCQRVMQLSCSAGVSPAVSAALGQAVARYRTTRLRGQGRLWSALATVLCLAAVGFFAVAGLKNMYRMELERGVQPLFAAAIGVLGVAELAAGAWFLWLARRMAKHLRYFWSPPS